MTLVGALQKAVSCSYDAWRAKTFDDVAAAQPQLPIRFRGGWKSVTLSALPESYILPPCSPQHV